jgi:hypothetical protein
MFNVLVDTCVWLDLAQDPKQTPLLHVVESMVRDKALSLIVPRIVQDEFRTNRDRVAKASVRSLASHFQQVKEAVNKGITNPRNKRTLLAQLDDLNHKIPLIGGVAEGVLDRVDGLLRQATIVQTSDAIKIRAADRALNQKAPCHRQNKNSIADALVIETFFEVESAGKSGERFAFVTHNKNDFSAAIGNQKLPHADLAPGFSKIRSMYFISLAELLRRIDPSAVADLIFEQTWQQEPRGLSELLAAHEKLWRQVWYNRHRYREWMVQRGKIKIVSRDVWEKGGQDNQSQITDEIWKGALRAAKRTKRELGKNNVGPWTDFDWGMINGKLSAIRWVMGDEWDMLDT